MQTKLAFFFFLFGLGDFEVSTFFFLAGTVDFMFTYELFIMKKIMKIFEEINYKIWNFF